MGSTGSDVEALCSKCGDVWHVVVAEVGGKIAKVQCKECGGYHRYRTAADKSSLAASGKRRTSAAPRRSKAPAAPEPPAVEPDLSKPIRPYNIRDLFEPADRVDHPSFGIGVVEGSDGPGKMTVAFPQGRKVLAMAKPKATLERPERPELPQLDD